MTGKTPDMVSDALVDEDAVEVSSDSTKMGNARQAEVGSSELMDYNFSDELTPFWNPSGVDSSSIGALRNHIVELHLREGRRSLAVTGPSEGVGCTLLAANLAISAAQSGIPTLLVDTNLRSAGVEQYISPDEQGPGLSDYLSGKVADPSKIIKTDVIRNLSIIYSGSSVSNPQALLASDAFKSLMNECARSFSLTVVDTPPANVSSDVRRIASVLRYAIVTARRDVSYVSDVRTLVEELKSDRVRVLGTFLNVG